MRRLNGPGYARSGGLTGLALVAVLAACEAPPPVSRAEQPATPLDSAPEIVARQSEPAAAAAQDTALAGRVTEAITARPELKVEALQVSVREGVVTLEGVARSPADRREAALTALKVEGVRSVINELEVKG